MNSVSTGNDTQSLTHRVSHANINVAVRSLWKATGFGMLVRYLAELSDLPQVWYGIPQCDTYNALINFRRFQSRF